MLDGGVCDSIPVCRAREDGFLNNVLLLAQGSTISGDMFFASTFSSKMQIDFLKVAWGISPVLHFLRRHSFRCRRGAVAGIQSLLVTDM